MALNLPAVGEKARAPSILNRPWQQMLAQSGYAIDGSDFGGFAKPFVAGASTYPVETGELGVVSTAYPRGNLYRYGAVGNGIADDTAAINAWYAAIPAGGRGKVTYGLFRFTATLVFNRQVSIDFDGPGCAFKPDVGAAADGIVFNNTVSASVYLLDISLSVLSATVSCCRNAVVFNRVHNCSIYLHVKAKATQYGVVMNGCLSNRRFLLISTTNAAYDWPAAMPVTGTFRLLMDTVNTIACNANKFTLIIEGGADPVRVEDQQTYGNNTFEGVIEGQSSGTNTFYAKNCTGMNIQDLHFESGAAYPVTLDGCQQGNIGPGVMLFGQSLSLVGCKGVVIDKIQTDGLTLDANCNYCTLGQIIYGIIAGTITDNGKGTIWRGPIVNAGGPVSNAKAGPAESDFQNLFRNGTFERWPGGDTATPADWSFVGGGATWAKTGTGLGDATRAMSRYAAKVTTAALNDGAAFPLDWNIVANRWVTVFARIKVVTGQPNVSLRMFFDAGLAVTAGPTLTTKDAFVLVSHTFWCDDAAYNSVSAAFVPAAAGNFYLADVGYAVGINAFRGLGLYPSMIQTELVIEGQSLTFAATAPAAGLHRIGDKVFNTGGAIGSNIGWHCTATGTPGTWVPYGIIGESRAAALANVATADASDLATAIALANSLKVALNQLLTNRRTANEQA